MIKSTRGNETVSSMEAILNGLAEDGGLYVFDKLPSLDYHDYLNMSYQELASKIISSFFTEFSYDDILAEVNEAYKEFDIAEVVKLKELGESFVLELFHGPTLAFKDLALVVLPRLMRLSKERLGIDRNITILTATSGDTGGACLNGFKDIDGINIIVLYPNGGVSPVQEAQMCSFRGKRQKVIAVNGNFDDCQSFVKKFFSENKDLSLSSANSINIGRLIPQMVYYFYSYIYLYRNNYIKENEEISFSVPTGNFGNILAGMLSKMCGLPIKSLICSSNKNNVLTDFFNKGIYDKNREFYKTNSPSMDILVSSNLERFLYYASDSNTTASLMNKLNKEGKYEFKNPFSYFYAYTANEEKTLELIKYAYDKYNYLIDPHTAVAYNGYLEYSRLHNERVVILSTASPFKFPRAILDSLGIKYKEDEDLIKRLSQKLNLKIPSVLNYPSPKRALESLDGLDLRVRSMILCMK